MGDQEASWPEELEDRWTLGWHGLRVEQIRVDYALTLIMGDTCHVRVEESYVLRSRAEGASQPSITRIDPQTGDAAAALVLLWKTVVSSTAWKNGTLLIELSGNYQLEVEPSEQFEAWTADGPGAAKWVCSPGGGGLSVWL